MPNELKDKILKTIVSNCDKEELTKEVSKLCFKSNDFERKKKVVR